MENFDNFKSISKVHIIGIGGVSMSAIAKLLLNMGKIVSGSDRQENAYTKELLQMGINISIGHKKKQYNERYGFSHIFIINQRR